MPPSPSLYRETLLELSRNRLPHKRIYQIAIVLHCANADTAPVFDFIPGVFTLTSKTTITRESSRRSRIDIRRREAARNRICLTWSALKLAQPPEDNRCLLPALAPPRIANRSCLENISPFDTIFLAGSPLFLYRFPRCRTIRSPGLFPLDSPMPPRNTLNTNDLFGTQSIPPTPLIPPKRSAIDRILRGAAAHPSERTDYLRSAAKYSQTWFCRSSGFESEF